jgi:hypothetical protein
VQIRTSTWFELYTRTRNREMMAWNVSLRSVYAAMCFGLFGDGMKYQAATLLAVALLAGGPALAASALEEQLAKATKASMQPLGPAKPIGDTQAQNAAKWSVANDGSNTKEPCGMTFISGSSAMGYIGPYRDWKDSYFFVTGPDVPTTAKVKKLRVTLASDGDSPQTVNAWHYPVEGSRAAILFQTTGFSAALDAMDDAEKLSVTLDGASVFNGSWTDGFTAREKVRQCLLKLK